MKKKVVAFVALMLASLMIFSLGAKLARADQGIYEKSPEINAKSYLLTDFDGTTEIASSNKTERLPIASMVKIMTLDLVFEKIEKGQISLGDDVTVSENASAMGGSQAFLGANLTYKAEELIKSVIVASANDSCVALAEHCAGSAESFVSLMNQKARELGMTNTNFVNCTGLPAPGGYSCAEDVAKMTRDLLTHNRFFNYSQTWMYDFIHPDGRKTTLTNTNKLSRFYIGCDGGKTGFTKEAGSCLSATAKRDDTRLICVVIGAPTSKDRNAEVSKLFNYGFANYSTSVALSEQDAEKLTVNVNNGKTDSISCKINKPLAYFGKRTATKNAEVKFIPEIVFAPVKEGDRVGRAEAYADGKLVASIDVFAAENVEKREITDVIRDIAARW